jgi:hypothetical protein
MHLLETEKALVAQWIARLPPKEKVARSNLVWGAFYCPFSTQIFSIFDILSKTHEFFQPADFRGVFG